MTLEAQYMGHEGAAETLAAGRREHLFLRRTHGGGANWYEEDSPYQYIDGCGCIACEEGREHQGIEVREPVIPHCVHITDEMARQFRDCRVERAHQILCYQCRRQIGMRY